jgi:hypothetical protein
MIMKKVIQNIKALTTELYNAEVSKRDIEIFNTLGLDKCKQIEETLMKAKLEEQSLRYGLVV